MLSIIDVPFLLICLLFAVRVAAKGFTKEFFSKLAILAGAICAIIFFRMLDVYLVAVIKNNFACSICSFIIIFLMAYLVVTIVQQIVQSSLGGQEILAGLDKVMGFFLGALEGLVLCAVVLLLLRMQPWLDLSGLYEKSLFYEKLRPLITLAERKVV